MSISITQEQAAALLPLLPHLVAQVPMPTGNEQVQERAQENFSTVEMLAMKKNSKATSAQRYLLVNYH